MSYLPRYFCLDVSHYNRKPHSIFPEPFTLFLALNWWLETSGRSIAATAIQLLPSPFSGNIFSLFLLLGSCKMLKMSAQKSLCPSTTTDVILL